MHLSPTLTRSTFARRWLPLAISAALSGLAVLGAPDAVAQDVPAVVPPAAAPLRQLSVTISPLHLVIPMLEVTGEYAVQPKLGVALVAGYGTLNQASATVDKVSILELGAQARYYLLGDFEHGLQVGAEVLYIAASASGSSGSTTATATGEGVSVGPFVGYKFVSSMGFTFDTQLGAARTGLGAKASASTGETASRSETSVGPLLNINLGWTF